MAAVRRVLIWSAFYPPHVGGYEKNVRELAVRLVGLGDEVTVVTSSAGSRDGYTLEDGSTIRSSVRVRRVPHLMLLRGLYPVPLPSAGLASILRDGKYDVALTQTRFFPLSAVGVLHATQHRIPLIHVERGSQHTSASGIVDRISRLYDHTIGSSVIRRAKAVVGVSGACCRFAEHLGAPATVRIPNGVRVMPRFPLRPGVPVVLYVGRLVQAKGVQDLIAAFKRIEHPCRLVIVGDGPYRKRLEEQADGDPNIHFAGEMRGGQLITAYQTATVFVNPSYSEGLPTSVMEAMAAGVPVIATAVGGTSELIHDGVTGILVRPGPGNEALLRDRLLWMLGSPAAAAEMASRAYQLVEQEYSWDTVVRQYDSLLGDICRV